MPSSGRWVVLFTERVSPPRRRVPFCTGRKEPKSRQGVGAIGRNGVAAPASMPPTPWTPVYGGYPLGQAEHFRRAKSEWLSAISSGPLGPGFAKIAAAAVPRLRLTLPSQRSRSVFRRRGGTPGPPVAVGYDKCRARRPGAPSSGYPQRLRLFCRGGACPSRRPPEPHLSPNTPKGALSTRRSRTERLPNPQRQR